MKVPLFDAKPVNIDLYERFVQAFQQILRSGQYILGDAVTQFERHFAEHNGSTFALGVSSGTDALLAGLLALGIQAGDEVLCPSFTFFATASTVARLGAIPVWVDVHPEDFCIDLADAEQKISPKTKAIIPVHLFGQSCDAASVLAFAQRHHLLILEDVAQAQGAMSGEHRTGTWGHMGAFSFFPTKNLGGFGDAGLVTTQSQDLFEKALCLRVHGSKVRYQHTLLGGNFRIDALQAALLDIKLPYVEEVIQVRRMNAQLYRAHLSAEPNIILPQEQPNRRHTWNQFTLRVPEGRRDALKAFLEGKDIGCAIYYPKTLDRQPALLGISTDKGVPTEHAHQLETEVLSLPIYPGLQPQHIEYVCAAIRQFFRP